MNANYDDVTNYKTLRETFNKAERKLLRCAMRKNLDKTKPKEAVRFI